MPKGIYKHKGVTKGKHWILSKKARKNISIGHKKFYANGGKGSMLGKKHTKEWKKKMSERTRGKNHYNWKGGRVVSRGYIYIHAPNHPHQHNHYIAEHRMIMEKHLGRYLTNNEAIHHKNKIRNDNRIENLQLVVCGKIHYGEIKCPFCEKEFLIR